METSDRTEYTGTARDGEAALGAAAALPLLIAYCDRERRFRFVNQAYAARFGATPADLVGRFIWEVVGQQAYSAFHADTERALAGEVVEYETRGSAGEAAQRHLRVTYIPQPSREGEIDGFIVVIADVTDRRRAEIEALQSRELIETVSRVGQAITGELDARKAVQAVTDAATQLVGAELGMFVPLPTGADSVETSALHVISSAVRDDLDGTAAGRTIGFLDHACTGDGVVRRDDVPAELRAAGAPAERLATATASGVRSCLAVPVVSRSGEPLGRLLFGHGGAQAFTEYHERLVLGLAAQLATAIDRARLYEAEHEARAIAERAQERLAFLAEAGAVLASSLDYGATLEAVARLAVRSLADYCVIDVLEDDGRTRRLATHVDPAMEPVMEFLRDLPPPSSMMERMGKVLRTGVPDVVNDLDLSRATEARKDPRRRDLLVTLRPRAYMIVALIAHGRTLGTMTFVTSESGRRYHRVDVSLAQELARRAAIAIDNARAHEAERRARGEAEAANRAKDEFLSVVSHELRTPLNSILGWVRVLEMDRDGRRTARAIESIERSVRAQARLIEDLIDVSRIASRQLRLDARPVQIPAIVRAAAEEMRPAAEAKGVRLQVALDDSAPALLGDPDRVLQIAANLLSNAVKFTPTGGQVDVRFEQGADAGRLVVRDTGKGIPSDFLPHVFEPFRQAESVASRRQGGLGLGLAITRHLVELHGWTIRADSDGEGAGATFTVSFPLPQRGTRIGEGGGVAPAGGLAVPPRTTAGAASS